DDTVQMLEQVDPAMAAQMKNITPEQQKELEQQLNVVFEKMGTMSPEELKHLEQHPEEMFDFVEKTVAEQAAPMPPAATPIPSTTIPEEKPKVTPTPTPVKPTQETIKTADLLDKIISITEEFMLNATTANLESKINRWAEKNKIKNWQTGLRYKKFKEQLLALVKSLRAIKEERDPETKQLVYIDALSKNSALLTSLQRLNTTLTNQWNLVELPEQDLDSLVTKLSRETKTALKAMLGAYAQAPLNMPLQLDALMKEYDPRTKELREKEAQLSEKALKERKLPYARPMGDLSSRESGYGRGGSTYPYDYSGYGPYSGDYGSYNQPYGSYPGGSAEGDSGKAEGEKGGSGKGDTTKSKTDTEEEEKAKKLKASTPPARKDRALELTKEDIKEFEKYLIDAKNALKAPADILNNPADTDTATQKIARVQEPLTHLKHEIRLLDKKDKEKYAKKIAEIWKPLKETFDSVDKKIDTVLIRGKQPATSDINKKKNITKKPLAINAPSQPSISESTPITSEVSGEDLQRLFGDRPYEKEIAEPITQETPATKKLLPQRTPEEETTTKDDLPEQEPKTHLTNLSKKLKNLIQNLDEFTAQEEKETASPQLESRKKHESR
ncbi:MAG: hypothetical protein U1E02_11635, partial [Hydrogenophaga sp.]|nr:hypothetical protein [Hydrogenophaga sp.]